MDSKLMFYITIFYFTFKIDAIIILELNVKKTNVNLPKTNNIIFL